MEEKRQKLKVELVKKRSSENDSQILHSNTNIFQSPIGQSRGQSNESKSEMACSFFCFRVRISEKRSKLEVS